MITQKDIFDINFISICVKLQFWTKNCSVQCQFNRCQLHFVNWSRDQMQLVLAQLLIINIIITLSIPVNNRNRFKKKNCYIKKKKKKLRKNWRTFCLPFSYYADILCINLIKEFNMLLSTKGNTFLDFILHSDSVKLVIPMVLCCISFYHELDYKVFKEEKSLITEIILKY